MSDSRRNLAKAPAAADMVDAVLTDQESHHTRRYPWPRYWTAPGTVIDQGFFPDPNDDDIFAPTVEAQQLHELLDDRCLVLFGEPGLGKSHALKDAAAELRDAEHRVHTVNLGAYDEGASLIGAIVDAPTWREWLIGDTTLYLFLDGLDEALLHVRAIHKRLIEELEQIPDHVGRLRLRVSCRTADWLPGFDEQLAEVMRTGELPRRLQLAPLRVVDVELAAKAEGLDAEQFLDAIVERELSHLAAYPLTLRMLIDVAVADGALPDTQAELFALSIVRLAEEHDASRRRDTADTALHVGQRIAVAERIAAATLLSGRAAINSDRSAATGGDVRVREFAGYSEQDPDAAGAAHFRVGEAQIAEVLGTALFVDVGGGRLAFRHRSLAEYLAARYLVRHEMDDEQVMSLLAVADDPDGRLVPQLREVAVWAASMKSDVLDDLLVREPELLLRADNFSVPAQARERIVDALLHEDTAAQVARWDRRSRRALAGLVYDGLANQLRGALSPVQPLIVRQTALTIAQASALPELQADLLALAFDASEPAYLRDDAVWALKDHADADTRAALVPLATEWIEDDEDDEIKGQALEATYPSPLGVTDVLAALTPARNDSLLGAYKHFVLSTFVRSLTREDLPAALAWAETIPRDYSPTDLLSSLTDDILAAAWPYLCDQPVLNGVIAVIVPRLRENKDLLGPLHDRRDTTTFREEPGRLLVVMNLVAVITADPELHASSMVMSTPRLVEADDYQWVLAGLREALGSPQESTWAELAANLFTPETCNVEEMYELLEQSTALADSLRGWTDPVDLESPIARMWRQRVDRHTPPADAPDMDVIIGDELQALEHGDIDAWWRLNRALIFDRHGRPTRHGELEADLTRLEGWDRATEQTRQRIVAGASLYIEQGDPVSGDWFGTNNVDRRAFAGYRALYLLAMLRPAGLDQLDDDSWVRWMPILIRYPRSSGSDGERYDDVLIDYAAQRAPEALTDWALRMIDAENATGDGHLFVMWRLRNVAAAELVSALAAKLADDTQLRPQARADLASYGLRVDKESFGPAVAAHVTLEAATANRDSAVAVGTAVVAQAPALGWPLVEPLLMGHPDVGKDIIENIASGERADLASQLDDEALARLAGWMFEQFPPEDDPRLTAGGGRISPREEVGRMRDRMSSVLAQRGSSEATAAIDTLSARFPGPALQQRKREAREARLARWSGPAPSHVIQLAQSNDARIVLSDEHLQLAVLASVRRIQRRMQEGQPPTVRELWNTAPKVRPKNEEELSSWIAARLDEDLHVGGRVVGREPEVRPNATGKGRGESIDIEVLAPIGELVDGAKTARIMIEVKGCWHGEVKTAMSTQLVDRYLTGTPTRHGIYLVVWFAAENWESADHRQKRCRGSAEEASEFYTDQAHTVSAARGVTVRAVVLDAALPPKRGPARVVSRLLRRLRK